MPPRKRIAAKKASAPAVEAFLTEEIWASDQAIGGVPGPGKWLVFSFAPIALFSLKTSQATSGVGRTLLVPTPYSVKMAILDAGLRTGIIADATEAEALVRALARLDVRIGAPESGVVTQTTVKLCEYPGFAYREFVSFSGSLEVAVNLATATAALAQCLPRLAPAISYFGKRGSFVQYLCARRLSALSAAFTAPVDELPAIPKSVHFAMLDDFGPDATFEGLNAFSQSPVKRDRHRRFVRTAIPLALVRSGPGFDEYRRQASV